MAELPFFTGEEGRGHLLALLFFISVSVVTIWGTWQGALPESREAVLAQTAREILTTGDARTMHFDGAPVYDTPPLAPWLMSFFLLIFGVNEFAARFAFVLLSVLSCYLIYRAGRAASQDWGAADEKAGGSEGDEALHRSDWGSLPTGIGLLSAAVLASSPLFGRLTSHVTLGLPMAFFVCLAFLGWLSARNGSAGAVLWGAGIAGAILSGGGGGFFVILGGGLASLADRSRRGLWRRPGFLLATLLGVLAGGVWLFPTIIASGRGFFDNPLWAPIAGIARPPAKVSSLMLNSMKSLWLWNLPWTIPATFAVVRIIFSTGPRRRSGRVGDIDDALLIFAAVMFLPFFLAGAGDGSSLLSFVPFAAILSAREIARWLERPGHNLTKRVWTLNHVITALFCLLMLLVAATPLGLRKSRLADPMRDVARMAERMTSVGTHIGNFRQRWPEQCAQMLFYGNRSLERPRVNPDDVAAALQNDPRMIFLSSARDVGTLRGIENFPIEIRVLFGAGDLVLFGARESSADEAP